MRSSQQTWGSPLNMETLCSPPCWEGEPSPESSPEDSDWKPELQLDAGWCDVETRDHAKKNLTFK